MAKPDDRAHDLAHLQGSIDHTFANLNEAENYLNEHASEIKPEKKHDLEAKNARRKESINGFIAKQEDEDHRS